MNLRQLQSMQPPRWTGNSYQLLRFMLLWLYCITFIGCQHQSLVKGEIVDGAIESAVIYLHHEYNPEFALIRESPETAPGKHWLLTDNWLAATALRQVNDVEFATQIHSQITSYGNLQHGLIEAMIGTDIAWPPRTPLYKEISPGIWLEMRNQQVMEDWRSYADLALYRALDLYNEGRIGESRQQYETTIKQFDGIGFADQAFDGRYTTYKLALAVYIAGIIHAPLEPDVVSTLLSKQLASGGFSALYDETGKPIGDSNTETTSYALLALSMLQQK